MSIKETKDGVLLSIFVKPNSPKFRIELDGHEIVVYATEEPERGKVNKEIMKQFSKLSGYKVEIVSGFTSKQKVILLSGASKVAVDTALGKSGEPVTRKLH